MKIEIRQARSEDSRLVAELERACFPQAEAASEESLAQRLHTFPKSFFVAVDGERVVGMINGCVTNEPTIRDEFFESTAYHEPDGAYQSVFGLDVLPEYQRNGIAAQLMNTLIESAQAAGRKGMILTCKERLIPYYERFGYVCSGISKSTHGGAVWYDMTLLFPWVRPGD